MRSEEEKRRDKLECERRKSLRKGRNERDREAYQRVKKLSLRGIYKHIREEGDENLSGIEDGFAR